MTDIAKLAIETDTTSLQKGTAALTNFQKVSDKTAKSVKRNTNGMATGFRTVRAPIINAGEAAKIAAAKMKGFGNQARGVSLQLSQVAQQGSVTGNYFQALAIQLPDLLLGFGTMGILIGAVAGVLGVTLVNALTGSSKELKSFNALIDETKDGLKSVRLEVTAGAIDTLKDNIKEAADELRKLQNVPDKIGGRTVSANRRLQIQAQRIDEINELEKDQIRNNETLLVLEKRRADIEKESDDTSAAEAANVALEAEAELQKQLQTLEQGFESPAERAQRQATERAAIIQAAQDQELESIRSYADLKKQNEQQLSDELVAIAEREQTQKTAILSAGQAAGLSILGSQLGQMAALFKQGGKESFEEYKAFATAQAIISAALATNNALAIPVIGPGLAVLAATLGAAQVAVIQGQSYQGTRAMGGQVESGGSYLVGENGPEVLQLGGLGGAITPNHALDSGGGSTVITNVNIQSGVTKGEVVSLIPAIVQAATSNVKAEIARGGTMAKAVGRRA